MPSPPPPNPSTSTKSKPKVKTISNPRRLLILSPTSQSISIIPPLLTSLTGTPIENPPQQDSKTTPPDDLSGTTETPPTTTTFAGYTTHAPLSLSTKYYTAEVPLWVDEIPLPSAPQPSDSETQPQAQSQTQTPTAEQWKTEFLSPEAEIVRDAVGALVVCAHPPSESTLPRPDPRLDADADADAGADPATHPDVVALLALMQNIGAVKGQIDEERGGVGDVPGVFVLVGKKKGGGSSGGAIGSGSGAVDPDELALGVDGDDLGGGDAAPFSVGWWEDQFYDMGLLGWEVVQWDPKGDGEGEGGGCEECRVGMPRIKEVLETHDWSASGGLGGLGLDGGLGSDLESDDDVEGQLLGMPAGQNRGFDNEVHELEREMFGLRMAIERGGGDGFENADQDEEDGEDNGDAELDVESMESLMMRMQVIKDMSSELPGDERRRFAAKAVQDIMREL
ncbi:uncharacterized protein N7511_001101 [Penicillium nucicola]|uniref:uncharacterized protein n=1 Tax=Penicillium nucicola TaxID=1850975 RepID=UPI002544E8CE|nr:uncharacterized protein N7511_001101 [Penicillium nucicola]KAJ5776090.1 hypothetical protein N7511_001101 [Penicillium nucicola]